MSAHVDIEKMRKRLEQEQKELIEQMGSEQERVEPKEITNPDSTEMAYDYDYGGRRMSLLSQLEEQLLDINRAQERIEAGTYGICTNCGQPIQAERLEALPWADLCIDCQREEEHL